MYNLMSDSDAVELLGVNRTYFQLLHYRMKRGEDRYKPFFVHKGGTYLIDINAFYKEVYREKYLLDKARTLYFKVVPDESMLNDFCRKNHKQLGYTQQGSLKFALDSLFNHYDEFFIDKRKLAFIERFIDFVEKNKG